MVGSCSWSVSPVYRLRSASRDERDAAMGWNESRLRRAEAVGAVMIIVVVLVAYVLSKLH